MAILETPAQFLTALGKNPFSADPLADLAREGYTLSPQLQSQLDSGLKDKKFARPPAGVTPADFKGMLTFQQAPHIAPSISPAAGNYDVLAGLTFAVVDTALDAVYQSGTIPHDVALDQLLSPGELTALGGFFKGVTGGHLSRLHITSAPTIAGTTDGSAVVALLIPIQLDWMQFRTLSTGVTVAKVITSAVGTLQLTTTLIANVVVRPDPAYSTMTIGAQLDTEVTSAADSPRLTLAPDSPVQLSNPAPPGQIDGTAVLIQNALAQQLGSGLTVSVSPVFNLPIGSLELAHADIVSNAGMLLVGLQIAGTGTTGATDPSQLMSLLPSDGSNIYLKTQDSVANALLQSAIQSGQLTAIAKQKNSNAVIYSGSARFQNDEFFAQVNGSLVDECPLSVDLDFTATHTVSLKLQGDSVVITQTDDHSITDLHNLLCLLTTLGLVGLAALAGAIFGGVVGGTLGGIIGFVFSDIGQLTLSNIIGGSGGGPDSTVVDLTQPIPDSDFLPTLSGGFFQIVDGGLLIGAVAGTRPDDINTIIYVRFAVPGGGPVVTATKPLSYVEVEVMVQDVPPPVSPQVPPNTSTGTGKHQVTKTYTFVPPTSDQQLAVGKTDPNGVVRFGLLTDQLVTTAGAIKEDETAYDADAQRFITTTTFTPVVNDAPDLYFRVTMPDGSVVDTRQLTGGLMAHFVSARIGTLDKPLTLTFGPTVIGNV
jgi:hypothetical protein